ncbi:mechanosensitive ion channel family protein [Rugamonas sp.]|uniref:mechanosensitive ion channel family protein n=1 Tax=Rugamonas sp. TaxID=1926287 RepID=UPI0025EB006E|nr:mechanosensitive ion channel family protein [Rugamonas sp.]
MILPHFFSLPSIDVEQLAIAAGVAALTFGLARGVLMLLCARLAQLRRVDAHTTISTLIEQALERTSNLALAVICALLGAAMLDLPPQWEQRAHQLWFITVGLQLALYADSIAVLSARRYFQRHALQPDAPASVAHSLIVWLVEALVWIVFVLALLSNLGINVTTFVASLGIGGIAVALAVQNILGDLVASMAIAIDKPFEVGDAISINAVSGTVEQVGLKTTRIRADSGEQVVMANSDMLKNTVRNFKRMQQRRVQFTLKVNASTTPDAAASVPAMLREVVARQADVRFERAHLKSLDPDWLEYEIVYYVLDPGYAKFMDSQQAVLLAMMARLADMGVSTSASVPHMVIDGAAAASPMAISGIDGPPRHALPDAAFSAPRAVALPPSKSAPRAGGVAISRP